LFSNPWYKIPLLFALLLLAACAPQMREDALLDGEHPAEDVSSGSGSSKVGSAGTGTLANLISPTYADITLVSFTATPAPVFTSTPTFTPTETASPTYTPTHTLTPTLTIRFAVIGDYGLTGQPAEDVAALVKSWLPDLILTTGDNNYPLGSAETIDENIGQYYHEYIYPYKGIYGEGAEINRFFPTLGNHEFNTLGAQPYLEYFTLLGNERYYDFIWGPVHFFAVNSDSNEPDGFRRDSLQANWLKQGLANSDSPWKIVYMHHSPYSSGTNGPISWIQWPFMDWGATAVLSGHDHTYERLFIDGLPYFVNGLGGGPRYDFLSVHPGSKVRFRDDYGAMLVEADEAQITFEFITRLGERVDLFTLSQ
jgi:tartrate-resistant acid phosphatase type 5